MNSRAKGKRGERQWRDELRAAGYAARRGQQFAGSAESPDVVCEGLGWAHFEVKLVERLNVYDAMEQARRDAGVGARGQRSEGGGRAEARAEGGGRGPCGGATVDGATVGGRARGARPSREQRSEGGGRAEARSEDGGLRSEGADPGKVAIVAHRRRHWPWLVTMEAETFFRLVRGELGQTPEVGDRRSEVGEGLAELAPPRDRRSEGGKGDLGAEVRSE